MTEPETDRPTRTWRIPSRLFGRVRTSTMAFGVCFVLTALLYNQVNSANEGDITGPTPIDPSQYQTVPQPSLQQQYTEPSTTVPTTTPVEPTTTADPSGTVVTPGQPGSSTGESGTSTSQDPTYLPGLTVPPGLRSLLPPAPSATGTP